MNLCPRIINICARYRGNICITLLPFYFPTPVSLDRMLSGSESDTKGNSPPLTLPLPLPKISVATAQFVPRLPRFVVSRSYTILLCKSDQLVAYTTHNRRASMPSEGFEFTIPSIERQQSCALDSTATGISLRCIRLHKIMHQERQTFPICEGRWLHPPCRLHQKWRLTRILSHVKPGNTCSPYTYVLYTWGVQVLR